jgi:hypothetical protein
MKALLMAVLATLALSGCSDKQWIEYGLEEPEKDSMQYIHPKLKETRLKHQN